MSTTTTPTTPPLEQHQQPQPLSSQQPSSSSPSHSHHDSSVLSQSIADESPASRSGDMEKHPKGKRKRTAAKDKLILEEAYLCNPKPDKQARQQIVDRVSLNEKEVQIWFQNRRQNDRRKSRPLSPEELAALRFGGMHHVSSDPAMSQPATTAAEFETPFPSSDPAASRSAADQGPVSPPLTTTKKARPELTRSYSDAALVTPRAGRGPQIASTPSSQGSESMSHSLSSSVGYLANRWNLGSSFSTPSAFGRGGDDYLRPDSHPPSCSSDKTHDAPNKSQSHVRLSLSLEGKAELISNQTSPTRPPPPRTLSGLSSGSQPRPRAGLSRSHSALPSISLPPISALTNSLPPRLSRGRSRDVQAWESCADSERRDELMAQAEHESNGSAIAAISLLRSSSGILQPSSTKRNASLSRPQQPRQAKKAKLSRTTSTYARLENIDTGLEKSNDISSGKVKVSMLVSPTDSDKENWSPDEDGQAQGDDHHRRPLPASPVKTPAKHLNSRRPGRVLQDHKGPNLLSNRANTAPSGPLGSKASIEIFQDGGEKRASRQDDVEKFMRGEVSPSKKPDMDCVAGLLSLSQGAWR